MSEMGLARDANGLVQLTADQAFQVAYTALLGSNEPHIHDALMAAWAAGEVENHPHRALARWVRRAAPVIEDVAQYTETRRPLDGTAVREGYRIYLASGGIGEVAA